MLLLLLDPYVDVILALALAYLSLKIVQALFGPLTGIVGIGSAIKSAEHAISQSIANACGAIFGPVDGLIGGSLHGIASLIRGVASQIRAHARLIEEVSALAAALALAYHGVKNLGRDLHNIYRGIDAKVKTLERDFHGIEHGVRQLQHDLTKGIGHDLRAQVRTLDKELAHIEHGVVPSLREAEAEAATAISNLYAWARGKADLIGIGTFAGAIAVALSALGLDWIKCREGQNLYKQHGCGMWNLLGNLLGLAGFLTIAFDFQEFVDASETVAQFIGSAVGEFEGAFPVSLEPLPPPQG